MSRADWGRHGHALLHKISIFFSLNLSCSAVQASLAEAPVMFWLGGLLGRTGGCAGGTASASPSTAPRPHFWARFSSITQSLLLIFCLLSEAVILSTSVSFFQLQRKLFCTGAAAADCTREEADLVHAASLSSGHRQLKSRNDVINF